MIVDLIIYRRPDEYVTTLTTHKNLDEYKGILVANKTDLVVDRVVSTEEGSQMAKSLDMDYMEVSVRLDRNVNETFRLIAKEIIEWLF